MVGILSISNAKDEKMKIVKVLNHNSVIVKNKYNQEVILTGKGIAYGFNRGDEVNQELIDKEFILNESNNSEFKNVYETLTDEELETTLEIIKYAKTKIENIDDTIYLTLADHIHGIVERFKKGVNFLNPLQFDIKLLYSTEYGIGLKALEIIDDYLFIKMPEDEAATIAIHIANACFFKDMTKLFDYMSIVKDVMAIVHFKFKIKYDESSLSYLRFLSHLKYLAQRIIAKDNPLDGQDNKTLLKAIKTEVKEYYECALEIAQYINDKYKCALSESEVLYLCINLKQIVSNTKIDK